MAEFVAWLVELGCSPPQWWTGRPKNGGVFTTDANQAMRFARREDAEGAIGHLVKDGTADGCKATEHIWSEEAASPATPVLEQVIERWREEARRYRDLAIQSEADSVTAPPFERGVAFGRGLCAKELEALADVARLPASQEEK